MKTYQPALTVLLLAGLSSSAPAEILSFQVVGKVTDIGFPMPLGFTDGASYSFNFDLDTTAPISFDLPWFHSYPTAIRNLNYSYNDGQYEFFAEYSSLNLTIASTHYWAISDNFVGDISTPSIGDFDFTSQMGNTILYFGDESGTALNPADIVNPLDIVAFRDSSLKEFRLLWINRHDGTSAFVFHSIDSISVVPEPSTYGAAFGVIAIGFTAWRRRSRRKS